MNVLYFQIQIERERGGMSESYNEDVYSIARARTYVALFNSKNYNTQNLYKLQQIQR